MGAGRHVLEQTVASQLFHLMVARDSLLHPGAGVEQTVASYHEVKRLTRDSLLQDVPPGTHGGYHVGARIVKKLSVKYYSRKT